MLKSIHFSNLKTNIYEFMKYCGFTKENIHINRIILV